MTYSCHAGKLIIFTIEHDHSYFSWAFIPTMKHRFFNNITGGELVLVKDEPGFGRFFYLRDRQEKFYTICWNSGKSQQVMIDNVPFTFPEHTLLPLMISQSFSFEDPESIIAWQFNREFYCIVNHDKEVGCVGFLFYGALGNLFLHLDEKELRKIILLFEVFRDEFDSVDNIQEEMLRIMLVRLIINVTRIAKQQYLDNSSLDKNKFDVIRKFNLLVETHYRQQHEVQYYAGQLHKSPKTLSNYFALYGAKSPLQIIQDRLILEAKRLFYYTEKSAKEVSLELGFEDASHFSRFFRNQVSMSPSEFKKLQKKV